MKNKLAIHIFRRDLRLEDNTALMFALENAESVVPVFIFDNRQVDQNDFRSENAVQFMIESLKNLDSSLNDRGGSLVVYYGDLNQKLEELIKKYQPDLVTFNKDYTPFSQERDEQIKEIMRIHNVEVKSFDDSLLNAPGVVLKRNGEPYTVFTPYKNKAKQFKIRKPRKNNFKNYHGISEENYSNDEVYEQVQYFKNENISVSGGREEGKNLLKNLNKMVKYEKLRDFPSADYTSHLSAHNKFGTISIREVYHFAKNKMPNSEIFISELYWRDFFSQIVYFFPHVIGNSFKNKYQNIVWENNHKKFKAWCDGETGFPIVDAGMRQLNETGYMHNRVRMIVASFLVKDLLIDWRWGEKYFAQKLVDYDPSVNNGSWQWAASTGCDAQPYFRIFNPWRQQMKFDKDCIYIKKWIPELNELSPKQIHNLSEGNAFVTNYPKPIVDHSKQREIAKNLY
ncbi:deoxyribodipyrimidine photo-lyase [Candidatus Peregrinibacteria bacterium]|nr:deoxyribodipyrimidine photo-lyase [Candidatus Peregrinibacteria bacterium]